MDIKQLWPELAWIKDEDLRSKTTKTWELALERSVLSAEDLQRIPFTLLCGPDLKVTFMDHKRSVVHIARTAGEKINEFYHGELPVDMDVVIAGAILADVGKLLEYEDDGEGGSRQSARGKYLRHPFTGVSVAMECGLPDAVCHIVATHAGEGNMVARTTEAWLVHHADFMTYEPFVKRLEL